MRWPPRPGRWSTLRCLAREGGYSDWVFARAERLRLDQAAEDRRKNLARKELAWLRRGPPARTSKPRYRIEAAEAIIAGEPEPRNSVELHAFARRRLGKDVLELAGRDGSESPLLTAPTRTLLDNVNWLVGPGDRIGLVGINGSGKSTLLRILVGDRPPVSGRVKIGSTVRLGYLSQEVAELPADLRLLEAVTQIAGVVELGGKQLTAGQLAERFGFTKTHQWTRVGELSGGERRRLQLLRILMAEPNVLVLDEPTNDLDTDTLAALGGPAGFLAGHAAGGQSRSVSDRAGRRHRRSRCSATAGSPISQVASTSTCGVGRRRSRPPSRTASGQRRGTDRRACSIGADAGPNPAAGAAQGSAAAGTAAGIVAAQGIRSARPVGRGGRRLCRGRRNVRVRSRPSRSRWPTSRRNG